MRAMHKVLGLVLMTSATPSWALSTFDLSSITGSQAVYDGLVEDLTAALSYKAIAPAEPLGITGFDIGIEVTGTEMKNVDQWGSVIGTSTSTLPMPKVHLHKGLPFGIDLGAVYSTLPGTGISYYGGELRYAIVSGNVAIPAVAVRGTYTALSGVDDMDLTTTGLELTVSKGFLMATPYAGIGNVWGNAKPSSTFGLSKSDPSMSKYFLGLNFNMGLMNLAGEWDKTGDSNSYSLKFGFRW